MGKLSDSAKAAASVYKAGGPIYDLQMARAKHGDQKVINTMTDDVMNQNPGMDYGRAAEKAVTHFNHVNDLVNGAPYFSDLRDRLDQAQTEASDTNIGLNPSLA